jgi:hypothetical protein
MYASTPTMAANPPTIAPLVDGRTEPAIHRHHHRVMNMHAFSPLPARSRLHTAVALIGVVLLAGCASTPPPTASLQAAQQAIARAEQNEAGRYAPEQLAEARVQLATANTAVTQDKMIAAKQMAEQSRVEADLASAKTADVKANAVNDEMRHSTATLVEEMQRNAGAQQ